MKFILLAALSILIFIPNISNAGDVNVKGYHRKDGTYVRPHVRSTPDSVKWNNYGPSGGVNMMNGKNRDADNDGTPNYLDHDDNNNGINDDNDSNQYRQFSR